MNLQVPQLECHVVQTLTGIVFAQRFYDEMTIDTDGDVHTGREVLRRFQKTVMDIFHDVLVPSSDIDDDFLDDDDPNVVDTYKLYREFKRMKPTHEIVSIVPMTIGGSVAFITNDTNPIIPLGQRVLNPHQ